MFGGGRKKMKKKLYVVLVTLLLVLTSIVIILNDLEVEATPGGGEGEEGIGLDYDFMWQVTRDLCNVTYKYPPGMIPKGRAWGTWGDNYTAKYILEPYMESEGHCGLSGVETLLIGHIDEDEFEDRKYSNKIVTKDFKLSFTHPTETYPYETPVPVTEIFPIPSGYPHRIIGGQMTHNYSFTDAHVYRLVDLTENRGENWPFGGTYNNYSLNVSGEVLNAYDLAIGNVSYLASNESLPAFQDGMVFMLEEEQGCEDKLENITNATACILVHNTSRGYQYQNATEATFSVVRIESDADNLTAVIDMLNNGEFMLVDNVLDSETFTFTYNLTEQNCIPTHDYFLLTQIRDPCITKYQYDDLEYAKTVAVGLYALNLGPFNLHHCHGIILYDSFDTHFMSFAVRDWRWFQGVIYSNGPALPMFSVNYSVGNWLDENISSSSRPLASGYLDQEYREQTSTTPGVDSYNVVGYRNITRSPNDNSVVISNRYDGWWGETPGDSGTGAGIVLGIAKYFNDYNITPKYNLTFLMTTGEEYGMRGAQHFYDSHSDEHHILWIGLDMVAFDQIGTNVSVLHTNETMRAIISAIANETDYPSKVDNKYGINITSSEGIGGTETYVWKNKCDCIAFGKDNQSIWRQYHRAGANYLEGDSLNHIDRDDANATFELVWNVTKYFTVNPDCWFEGNVCYESFDSSSDGDTLVDAIRANFTVNTSLPQDKVKVTLFYQVSLDGKETSWMEASSKEYVVTSNGTALSTVFSLPDSYASADISVRLKVYNSTARINDLAGIGSTNENDTSNSSEKYRLYHPLGYPHQGTTSISTNDRVTGSVFTSNENCSVNNITAYVYSPTCYPPYKSKGVIYQADDLTLIGETDERAFGTAYGGAWKVYPFSDPKPSLEKDTEYIIALWSEGTQLYYDTFTAERGRYNESTYGPEPPEDPVFINESRLYSLYCDYTPFAPKILAVSADPPVVGFGCNVTISAKVIGEVSGVDTVAVNISYPDGTWCNATMENTEENNYSFICSDTWLVGQYNYTIWAWGTGGNSNSSSGHSFNGSAQATISIATLEDSYGSSEDINLTDPPGGSPGNWTIDNTTVFIDDDDVYLSATPHTITGDGWVDFELLSKNYNGSIDCVFGFDTETAKPRTPQIWRNYTHTVDTVGWVEQTLVVTIDNITGYENIGMEQYDAYDIEYGNRNNTKLWRVDCSNYSFYIAFVTKTILDNNSIAFTYDDDVYDHYSYESTFYDWKPLEKNISVEQYEFNGYNRWYILENISIVAGKVYRVRAWIDVPFTTVGKYWWSIKPHHKNMSQAIADGQLFSLDPWWNTSWQYYRPITIESEFIDTDLVNVPILVKINDSIADQCDGGDSIRFLLPDNTTELYYEIEKWDDGSERIVWVNVTRIDSESDTVILMYYNNSNAYDNQNPTAVWNSEYAAVWHMQPETGGKGLTTWCFDSTSRDNDGTITGATDTVGKIGIAFAFDGINDYISVADDTSLKPTDVTLEAWFRSQETDGANGYPLGKACDDYWGNADGKSYSFYRRQTGDDYVTGVFERHSSQQHESLGQYTISNNTWYYLSLTFEEVGDDGNFYVDSVLNGTEGSCHSSVLKYTDAWDFLMGGSRQGAGSEKTVNTFYKCSIDEVRISAVARNSSWIAASYHTMNDSTDFLTWGSERSHRNQSKLTNIGSTTISGYLLVQLQYYNETQGKWVVDHDTINETTPRTINSSEQLALDLLFNGQVTTDDLSNGDGTYRVYAAFRDPDGNILQTEDETYLVSSYEFDVTFA